MKESVSNSHITIAVQALQNLSQDQGIGMFCTGLLMDLSTDLARFRSFRIISTTASDELPNRLDYLVRGIARYRNDCLQINLQLIYAKENRLVWAEKFEGPLDEIFQIEADVVQKIVTSLQQSVEYDLLAQIRQRSLTNLNAYENWLYGMEELKKGTLKADEKARTYFRQSLELDSNFARAYTGMSLTYFNEWSCLLWDHWEENQQASIDWALKAVELDAFDPVNSAILGKTYLFFKQYEKAEFYLRKSLELNPSDPKNLASIAFCMAFLGEVEEGLQLYKQAARIDPSQTGFLMTAAFVHFEASNFEKAVEIGATLPIRSGWIDFQATLAAAYFHLGREEEMQQCWQHYVSFFHEKIRPEEPISEELALKWMMTINPYRKGTQHQAFWDKMEQEISLEKVIVPRRKSSYIVKTTNNQILHQGDVWRLAYRGQIAQITDLKGLHDIVRLLAEPQKAFHCTDLMGVTLIESGAEVLDDRAKRDYQLRIQGLQEAIAEAEAFQNHGKLEQLRLEYDTLLDHLSQSLGKNGRSRTTAGSLEKARTAVTWRIRSAIKKIEVVHPLLAQHLTTSIKTGTSCSYQPEYEMEWEVFCIIPNNS